MKKLRLLLLCIMMTIVTLVQSVPAMADTGGSAAAGTLNIPKAVTIQVGETVTIDITGKPAVSTYVYNASYQKQMDYYDMYVKSFGTYWGKPGKVVLKGKNPGESELIITDGLPQFFFGFCGVITMFSGSFFQCIPHFRVGCCIATLL